MLPTAANAAVQVAIPKPATPQANIQYNKTIPIYYPRNKTENMEQDKEIFEIIAAEDRRQRKGIELIASENFVSEQVLRAMGSCLTNKYAEGYPGKRYYGGCECVDVVENLARDRAKALFGADHANVQPHSGASANYAVYQALCNVGDTVMGMNLDNGGHLTHGSPVNFSGKLFNNVFYGVHRETGCIDYDEVARIAREHKPAAIVAGASAYPRKIDFARFRAIADEVGAVLMVDMAHIAGLVAAGLHESPIPYAHITTTTTHKTLRGPRGGMILSDETRGKSLNSQIFPGIQGGPLMHVIAAKAVAFGEALRPGFKTYSQQIVKNAAVLAQCLTDADFRLVSGGTDNHLMLVDLTNKDVTGKDAEHALDAAGITVNKNTIPFETRSPFVTSGVRLGTAALTTRGMKEDEMRQVAAFIVEAIEKRNEPASLAAIRSRVEEFARAYPLFTW